MTVVHEGLKHQCDHCDKSYNQRNSLRRHIHESHPELLLREKEDSSKIQFEPTPDDLETMNFHINVPVKVEIDVDEEQPLETSIQVKEEPIDPEVNS